MSTNKKYSIKQTDKETLAGWLKLMLVGRAIDNRAPNYLKQAIGWSYHAPYAGHDGIQLAIGQVFDREQEFLDALVVLLFDQQSRRLQNQVGHLFFLGLYSITFHDRAASLGHIRHRLNEQTPGYAFLPKAPGHKKTDHGPDRLIVQRL